jgi:hypothetical protein
VDGWLNYTGRIMRLVVTGFALALGGVLGLGGGSCFAQAKSVASNPKKNVCAIITRAEAEAVVGAKLNPVEVSKKGTVCRYLEPGYDAAPVGKKHVTIDVYESDFPSANDANLRRDEIDDERLRQSPLVVRELPMFGDEAMWVWSGGSFGGLYAFKGGTLEVGVRISGISEEAALAAAKRFALRALKSSEKTGFLYNAPDANLAWGAYNVPGILKLLYRGAYDRIPDDALTRDYIVALVQGFNGLCPKMVEMDAVMEYGFYSAKKAGREGGFEEAMEGLRGSVPDVVRAGNEDAATFLKLNPETRGCESQPMVHIYKQMAEVALERRKLAPDVDDDKGFLEMMSSAMQAKYVGGFAGRPSLEMQARLQKVKDGCVGFAKGAGAEGFCRCQVEAAKESKLGVGDLDLLGARFSEATLGKLGSSNSGYLKREQACTQ